MIPIWLERYEEWARRAPCVRLYGDSTGGARGVQTAETSWEIIRTLLANAGLRVEFCVTTNGLELDRIAATNAQLWTGDGVGMYIDHDRARYLISDLQTVCFKENTNKIDKVRDPFLTHLSDALGYRCVDLRKQRTRQEASGMVTSMRDFMQR